MTTEQSEVEKAVLTLLSDGGLHYGPDIAKKVGISWGESFGVFKELVDLGLIEGHISADRPHILLRSHLSYALSSKGVQVAQELS